MATSKTIVAIPFYCAKTKKTYEKGDEYKGKRTDINHLFEKQPKGKAKSKMETK